MATHDYVLANASGAAFRTDLNNALAAIVSNNSNSSEPATKYAYQWWIDTSANIIKIRNSANNAWINLFTTAGGVDVDAASNFAAAVTFTDDVTFDGATAGRDVVFDRSQNALEFADSAELRFGTGDDMKIYHDGDNSLQFFDSMVGGVRFRTNVTAGARSNIILGAGVDLYYDNSKKLETQSSGIHILGTLESDNFKVSDPGNSALLIQNPSNGIIGFGANNQSNQVVITTAGDLLIPTDTGKMSFGASEDLKIYHDGGDNHIDSMISSHQLKIRAEANIEFRRTSANEVMAIFSPNGTCELYNDNVRQLKTHPNGIFTRGIFPDSDNAFSIGSGSQRFNTVFATQGINASDKNQKNTIVECDLGLSFINKLKPVSYKWNKCDGKTHYGLIAQDIEETIKSLGKNLSDFGCVYKKENESMGLAYNEIISPLIKAVQELSNKVAALEAA